MAEIQKGKMMDKRLLEWFCFGDVGNSSEAIVFVMCGLSPKRILKTRWCSYPSDSGDFGRCWKLLKLFPEWRERIMEMKCLGKIWGRIAEHWQRLESLHETGANQELYELLQKLQPDKDEEYCTKITIGKAAFTAGI